MFVPCQHYLQPVGSWPVFAVCAGPCSSVLPDCGASSPASGSQLSGLVSPQLLEPAHHRRSGSPPPLSPSHSGPTHLKTQTSHCKWHQAQDHVANGTNTRNKTTDTCIRLYRNNNISKHFKKHCHLSYGRDWGQKWPQMSVLFIWNQIYCTHNIINIRI